MTVVPYQWRQYVSHVTKEVAERAITQSVAHVFGEKTIEVSARPFPAKQHYHITVALRDITIIPREEPSDDSLKSRVMMLAYEVHSKRIICARSSRFPEDWDMPYDQIAGKLCDRLFNEGTPETYFQDDGASEPENVITIGREYETSAWGGVSYQGIIVACVGPEAEFCSLLASCVLESIRALARYKFRYPES
jgi:hypothetical protein